MNAQRLARALLCASALLAALPAAAAVPTLVPVHGALLAPGGLPVPDGLYEVKFRIHDAETGGKELWTEGLVQVGIKNGGFFTTLGQKTPLGAALAVATANGQAWLGVQVESEPELPRRVLAAVPFALRAALAEGLDCSGCIGATHLSPNLLNDFVKSANLAKVAVTGKFEDLSGKPDFSAYVANGALAEVALTGAFGDLKKVPQMAKVGTACGSGLAVKGIKADGSLDCTAVSASLPLDGLAQISNGLLQNVFVDSFAGGSIPIPDADPIGVWLQAPVPDLGTALELSVSIDLTTTSTGQIRLKLYAPDNTEYLLHDKGGDANVLKVTYPKPDLPVAGDLTTWVGKNPQGSWKLHIVDTKAGLGGNDGQVKAFVVTVKTLASGKLLVNGNLAVKGTVVAGGNIDATHGLQIPVGNVTPPCDKANVGAIRVDPVAGQLLVCDGLNWRTLTFLALCGNGVLNVGEECDDSNLTKTDACTDVCKKAKCGDGIVQAGVETCDDGNEIDGDACPKTCKVVALQACAIKEAEHPSYTTPAKDVVLCGNKYAPSNMNGACNAGWSVCRLAQWNARYPKGSFPGGKQASFGVDQTARSCGVWNAGAPVNGETWCCTNCNDGYNPWNSGKYLLADNGTTILKGSGGCCGWDTTFSDGSSSNMAVYCCRD
ncbi:MAG: DUF4215 domain-containing protein [Myxococcales bacterium]|nr:DUF4215 domain-containing protein [Myxococcales bacterium]